MMDISKQEYIARAELRYAIRRFLRSSEQNSRKAGITPQQYQLLLAVKGMLERDWATVSEIAERLQILHHAAVGLCDRAEEIGLVTRTPHESDRRQVCIKLTEKGAELLASIAKENRPEVERFRDDILKFCSLAIPPEEI